VTLTEAQTTVRTEGHGARGGENENGIQASVDCCNTSPDRHVIPLVNWGMPKAWRHEYLAGESVVEEPKVYE
jgi:hypothetical protein